MATYLAADTIRMLREERHLTQRQLAERIGVTDKAVSKWESGRGLPDIALIDDLAQALGVSVAELLTGDVRMNANRAGNMLRSVFYVCPICGNIVHTLGEGSFSCCGVTLPALEAEDPDETHLPQITYTDGCWRVTLGHPQTKEHFISFIAYVTPASATLTKLYPEQEASARFFAQGSGYFYLHCNRHGLYRVRVPRPTRPAPSKR